MRQFKWICGLLVSLVLASSCATTVEVRHLVPAQINLNGRRDLAIATATLPQSVRRPSPWIDGLEDVSFSLYSGWSADVPATVSTVATRSITDALAKTGYFSILDGRLTDGYMAQICGGKDGCVGLAGQGVTALMILDIPYIEATEQVIGRDTYEQVTKNLNLQDPNDLDATIPVTATFNELKGREYFLVQKATMTLTYTLHDTRDGSIIASRTFTDSAERETKIGVRTYGADLKSYRDERAYFSNLAPSFNPLFETIMAGVQEQIVSQLAPSWKSSRIPLLAVKPASIQTKEAERAVGVGEYQRAYQIYDRLWREGLFAAGYNAALLLEAMGKLDEALSLMDSVYRQSNSERSYAALLRIQEARALHEKAERQISGESADDGQGVLLTQYMVGK